MNSLQDKLNDLHGLGWPRVDLDSCGLGFVWTWIRVDLDSCGLGFDRGLDWTGIDNGTLQFGLSGLRRLDNLFSQSPVLSSFDSYHPALFPCCREMEAMVVGALLRI